jgi:Ser-tRNA(Ala) deacylase AlaX
MLCGLYRVLLVILMSFGIFGIMFVMVNTPQAPQYLLDTYCGAVTTEVQGTGEDEEGQWLVLANNIFHPQGGGQPADVGTIDDIRVVPFRLPEDRSVVAVRLGGVATTFAAGQSVTARIDLELRRLHAALHTAGHVIQAIAEKRGWSVVANNHFPGQARVEFKPSLADSALLADDTGRSETAVVSQSEIDRVISEGLDVKSHVDEAGFRTVLIGDWHATPCGGTHVRNLGDLAEVQLSSVRMKKGTARIAYDASHSVAAS